MHQRTSWWVSGLRSSRMVGSSATSRARPWESLSSSALAVRHDGDRQQRVEEDAASGNTDADGRQGRPTTTNSTWRSATKNGSTAPAAIRNVMPSSPRPSRPKYPDLKLIATAPVGDAKPDVLDEHYYRRATQNFHLASHYDKANDSGGSAQKWDNGYFEKPDRNGPKIFVGEWATREGFPTPDMGAALGDAAWMTGLERNSDFIVMAAYAPLLVNVNPGGMQWETNLIGYDTLKSYGSPAYYAQVMFNCLSRRSHAGVERGRRRSQVLLLHHRQRREEADLPEAGERRIDAAAGGHRSQRRQTRAHGKAGDVSARTTRGPPTPSIIPTSLFRSKPRCRT